MPDLATATKQQDYIYERPALTFRKLRMLEIAAGAPKRSNPGGRNGPGTVDTPAQWRAERIQAIGVKSTTAPRSLTGNPTILIPT